MALSINVKYGPLVRNPLNKTVTTALSVLSVSNIEEEPGHYVFCPNNSCYLTIGFSLDGNVVTSWLPDRTIIGPLKLPQVAPVRHSEILQALSLITPVSGAATMPESLLGPNDKYCIAMSIQDSPRPNSSVAPLANIWSCSDGTGGGVLPPIPPPEPEKVTCSIPGSITLDHGTLLTTELSGHKTTGTVGISCNGKGTIRLKFKDRELPLDSTGGIISKLYINNVLGGTDLIIDRARNISIHSLLEINSNAIEGGKKRSSTVLLMEVL